jgi:histone-lysine N-methyltransferase SETD3
MHLLPATARSPRERTAIPHSFARLVRWIEQAGGQVAPLALTSTPHCGRGIHATSPIEAGSAVLRIPRSCLLTTEAACASAIGQQIVAAGVEPESSHTWLAAYLLQERHAVRSLFTPYLGLLPRALSSYRHLPLLFDTSELELLRGSLVPDLVREHWESLAREYEHLCQGVPALRAFDFEEFVWARLTVASRVFGITIAGCKTQALVPGADLLNHQFPAETCWGYEDAAGSFVVTALQGFAAGQAVCDSYGSKCNSRYFLNYGFVLADNQENQARLTFSAGRDEKSFLVTVSPDAPQTEQMLTFLRGRHGRRRTSCRRLERPAARALAAACEHALSRFDTTLAEDDELLSTARLSTNQRNCILMRRGEKRVLHFLLGAGQYCASLTSRSARIAAASWRARSITPSP